MVCTRIDIYLRAKTKKYAIDGFRHGAQLFASLRVPHMIKSVPKDKSKNKKCAIEVKLLPYRLFVRAAENTGGGKDPQDLSNRMVPRTVAFYPCSTDVTLSVPSRGVLTYASDTVETTS